MTTKHEFLSDDWLAEAHRIVQAHVGDDLATATSLVVNVVATDAPGGGDRRLHIGVRDGSALWGGDHVDDADVVLTTDYETARAIFFAGDQQVVMEALLAGRMKIQGDLAKLLAAQSAGAGPIPSGLGSALHAMTADG